MKVVTIDPGVTTGVVVAYIRGSTVSVNPNQYKLMHKDFFLTLKDYKPDILVYEGFEYRPRLGSAELFPRELIGILKLYAEHYLIRAYEQRPSQGLGGFFKDKKKLMDEGLWVKGCPHGMDAMRHFLYWFKFGAGGQYNKNHSVNLV